MKKKFFSKHIAGGLAVALVATSALSTLTSITNSGSAGNSSVSYKNLDFNVVANAANKNIVLTEDDIMVENDAIKGFTATGTAVLADMIENSNSDDRITITFPDNVYPTATKIAAGAFEDQIKSGYNINLHLSNNIITIEENAFKNCTALNSVEWGNNLQVIKQNAFLNSGYTGELELPNTLTDIGENSFSNTKITKVTIPGNLTIIPKAAFADNANLTSVVLNEGLKVIGEKAFSNCAITTISTASTNNQFPESLEEFGEKCFNKNQLTTVKLPDAIKIIRGFVFANNKINSVDFGAYNDVNARRWYRDAGLAGIMIAAGMFYNNELESITLPEHIWAIGSSAFSNNHLKSVSIPSNVSNIYFYGFQNNPELKEVKFLTKDDGHGKQVGVSQIDRGAFEGCSIEGHLSFPDNMNEMGGGSFAGNKITSVDFGTIGPLIGYNSFDGNPIKTITGLDSWQFEDASFKNTKALKNVSFDYADPRPAFNYISDNAFENGLLRSINFPSYIKNIYSDAFNNNKGWVDGTNKVALYRVGSDGTTYITDNARDDSQAKDYVFNPVLVRFDLKDQFGNTLPITNLEVQRTRTVSTSSITTTTTTKSALVADFEHFKLGDKIRFTLPATPSGYELATNPVTQSWLNKVGNNEYEVTLDPSNTNIVSDVAYGDGYEVGYKQTVITINYRNTSNGGPVVPGPGPEPTPTPDTPTPTPTPTPDTTNPTDNTNNTPTDSNTTPVVDIDNQDTPQGDTDIDDDTTPQGSTKIKKNVKADKTTEVKVEDTKTPQGSLPKTGGSNENVFVLLGGVLLGLGFVVRKKLK